MKKNILLFFTGLLLVCQASAKKPGFALWQLSPQGPSQMNSYVFVTDKGRVVVLDGGTADDAPFLRGFIAALGNHVDKWIISHPHADHMGALTEILKAPQQMTIDTVYQSPMTDEQLRTDMNRKKLADAYFHALDSSGLPVVNLTEPGLKMKIDGMNMQVIGVAHPDILTNAYNNASIVLRVWDKTKSMVFLGDTGVESGERLLESPYKPLLDCDLVWPASRHAWAINETQRFFVEETRLGSPLDCDYLQMAHHGQQGCDERFYRSIRFRACLWPTPLWVWNNDVGEGFNTAWMKTIDTRRWMDEIGIEEHYPSWQGIVKIE